MPTNGAVEGVSKAALAMLYQLLHDQDIVDACEQAGVHGDSIARKLNSGVWDAYDSLSTITAMMRHPGVAECIVDRIRSGTAMSEEAAREAFVNAHSDFERALSMMVN